MKTLKKLIELTLNHKKLNYKKFRLFTVGIFVILYIRYLQKQYIKITKKNIHRNHSNQVLSKLKLIQAKLYYYKSEFHAWGWYHLSPCFFENDQKFYDWLFPQKPKDLEEIDIVVWYNPEAVTFYSNELYKLNPGKYNQDTKTKLIIKQLKKWNRNN